MSSSIYEEALADVKKLKEVAEQNAKNAIIDAVTPKIREMIENQLIGITDNDQGDILNDLAESLLDNDVEDIQLTSESLKALSDLVNVDQTFNARDAELNSLLVQERLLVVMDNASDSGPDINELAEMKSQIYNTHKTLQENKETVQSDEFNRIQKRLASLDYFLTEAIGEKEMNNRNLRNILDEETIRLVLNLGDDVELEDLDAVSVDVETVAEDAEEAEAGEVSDDEEAEAEEAKEVEEVEGDKDLANVSDAIAESDNADEELLDINEEQLAGMIRSILNEEDDTDMADEQDEQDAIIMEEEADDDESADEGEYAMEGELPDDAVVEISESMLRDELAKLRSSRKPNTAPTNKITESNMTEDDLTEVATLKTQLRGYKKAVSSLRGQLDESNLFNAKLLYANKLLQNRNLNDRQRVNIVESLDDAKSLREVRLLYKSLTESVTTKGNLTESKRRRAAGSASRTMRTGSVSKESYPETDRWALLAGINK